MNAAEEKKIMRTWNWEGRQLDWFSWRRALGVTADTATAVRFYGRDLLTRVAEENAALYGSTA